MLSSIVGHFKFGGPVAATTSRHHTPLQVLVCVSYPLIIDFLSMSCPQPTHTHTHARLALCDRDVSVALSAFLLGADLGLELQ